MSFHNHDPEERPYKRAKPTTHVMLDNGWTSSEFKMPEENVGVLVFIPEEEAHITSGMWDVSKKWVLLDEYRIPTAQVTYWRELPKPPRDDSYQKTFKEESPDQLVRRLQKENLELNRLVIQLRCL